MADQRLRARSVPAKVGLQSLALFRSRQGTHRGFLAPLTQSFELESEFDARVEKTSERGETGSRNKDTYAGTDGIEDSLIHAAFRLAC